MEPDSPEFGHEYYTPPNSYESGYTPIVPSTVNSRQFAAFGHDGGFGDGEFLQAGVDVCVAGEMSGETDVRRMMPRFRFVETAVKLLQLGILSVIAQQDEAFTTAGFDECSDQ